MRVVGEGLRRLAANAGVFEDLGDLAITRNTDPIGLDINVGRIEHNDRVGVVLIRVADVGQPGFGVFDIVGIQRRGEQAERCE